MVGPYVHRIDPVLLDVAGVHLWWYGLSYALGFLQMFWFLRTRRARLGLTLREAHAVSLLVAVGVLAGGRAVEVAFDEWPFYREHPSLIPALWLGGMATHGLLLGAAAATWLFARIARKPFLEIADAIVIPGACVMGLGRIGNFIDGQIVGHVTGAPWGVLFPDAAGFRHPVVLYDALKNLLLVPALLRVRRGEPPPGRVAAHFVFWYAFLRMFVDLFREYPTHRLPWGTGQTLNAIMAAAGCVLLICSYLNRRRSPPIGLPSVRERQPGTAQRLALAGVIVFSLMIPSNWTQDVPARYGHRHPGLRHSIMYPPIDTRPRARRCGRPEGLRYARHRSSSPTPARRHARCRRGRT